MRNRTEAMNRLMRKMWTNGWVPVMGANIPFEDIPNPDAVFIKEGEVIMANLVYLPSGNSKRSVKEGSDELRELEMRASPGTFSDGAEITIGFVVAKSQSGEFCWMDRKETNAHYQEDHKTLDEVILG